VLDGETGIVVPPEDPVALAGALSRLLDDPSYARRLGVNARSRVEEHLTWDAVVERMTPALERVAGAGPGTGRFRRGSAERVASS
jgi:glycosyltransferase involved in cell wall biosynthesis